MAAKHWLTCIFVNRKWGDKQITSNSRGDRRGGELGKEYDFVSIAYTMKIFATNRKERQDEKECWLS